MINTYFKKSFINLLFLFNILKKRSGSKAALLVLLYIYYSKYSDNSIFNYYKYYLDKYNKTIEDIQKIPDNIKPLTIKL